MNFYIMTLFPDMVRDGLNTSIIGRAVNKGLLSVDAINIRDYAFNKHQSVDDYPYGGGAGMLMQAEPVYQTYKALQEKTGKRIFALYFYPHRERPLISLWQKNLPRKRIWYFFADIMRESMSES